MQRIRIDVLTVPTEYVERYASVKNGFQTFGTANVPAVMIVGKQILKKKRYYIGHKYIIVCRTCRAYVDASLKGYSEI